MSNLLSSEGLATKTIRFSSLWQVCGDISHTVWKRNGVYPQILEENVINTRNLVAIIIQKHVTSTSYWALFMLTIAVTDFKFFHGK